MKRNTSLLTGAMGMAILACIVALVGCPSTTPKVEVPDMVGLSLPHAQMILEGIALQVGTVTREYHPTILTDFIIQHTPPAGAQVELNTSVDFTLSDGPGV